jgi:hypothetical protein
MEHKMYLIHSHIKNWACFEFWLCRIFSIFLKFIYLDIFKTSLMIAVIFLNILYFFFNSCQLTPAFLLYVYDLEYEWQRKKMKFTVFNKQTSIQLYAMPSTKIFTSMEF